MPTLGMWAGEVKNALGQPIAQASIAVLSGTLPAYGGSVSVATQPGSPLATIYSDPNGNTPISQPLQTDGLGNFQFWALPGNYVLQMYGSGINPQFIQQITIGAGGGSGGATDIVQNFTTSGVLSLGAGQNLFATCVGGGAGINRGLPPASGLAGQRVTVIKTDSGVGAVGVSGAFGGTYYLSNQYQYAVFESDGIGWYIVGAN